MKIKNLTAKSQYVWVRDLLGGDSVKVEVLPSEPRELAKNQIPDRSKMPEFDKFFKIEGAYKSNTSEEVLESNQEDDKITHTEDEITPEDDAEEEEDDLNDDIEEDNQEEDDEDGPIKETDKFLCDVCGAEFASSRGLSSHMKRDHNNN